MKNGQRNLELERMAAQAPMQAVPIASREQRIEGTLEGVRQFAINTKREVVRLLEDDIALLSREQIRAFQSYHDELEVVYARATKSYAIMLESYLAASHRKPEISHLVKATKALDAIEPDVAAEVADRQSTSQSNVILLSGNGGVA